MSVLTYQFVLNSKDPLATLQNPHPELCDAFLISEHYATASEIKKTLALKDNGCLVVSDNGNFTRMGKIASKFAIQGDEILKQAKLEFAKNKKVSDQTLAQRQQLVQAVVQECINQQNNLIISKVTARQLKSKPDIFIGMEDFTIPVLSMAGMLDSIFSPVAEELITYQKATQQLFSLQASGQFGHAQEIQNTNKYIVYHASDYDTAFQAASMSKAIDKQGIAISFGGPMANNNFTTSMKIAGQVETFIEPLPESYLSAMALVLGVLNGDKTDVPIHILGLGTPILIVLLGYALRNSKKVTIDSTSTFKDADDGKLFSSTNAYMKMDMYKTAAYALIDDVPYTSSSLWFHVFDNQFPSDWKGLQSELKVLPTSKVEELAIKLKANPLLIEKYIPFFTP